MVDRQLAFSILQLVALSLPAFAILLQIVVEGDIPYTHWAVPATTVGFGLFLLAGGIILAQLVLATSSTVLLLTVGLLICGILSLLIGAIAIGLQTGRVQHQHMQSDE